MPRKKHHINLSKDEREFMEQLSRKQNAAALKVKKAKAILAMDCGDYGPGKTDLEASHDCGLTTRSLENLRQRVCEVGPEQALERKPRTTPPVSPKITGEVEARMIQIACSQPPEGRSSWTMQLIADQLIELNLLESISGETVRLTLNRNDLKPWKKECWCIPPEENADFVAAMEDVLGVYHRPVDPRFPVVCLDEFCKQLVSEKRVFIPAQAADGNKPARPQRYDYEYTREGVASAFMITSPHAGTREVFIGKDGRRTAIDYAEAVEFLCEEMYPDAQKIILVQDNLNTHNAASLYKKFPPEKARSLIDRIEWHYTPKHGSWLNMAEIEISVLARTGLSHRIASLEEFQSTVKHNIEARNQSPRPIDWTFDNEKARTKLKRLYPKIESNI